MTKPDLLANYGFLMHRFKLDLVTMEALANYRFNLNEADFVTIQFTQLFYEPYIDNKEGYRIQALRLGDQFAFRTSSNDGLILWLDPAKMGHAKLAKWLDKHQIPVVNTPIPKHLLKIDLSDAKPYAFCNYDYLPVNKDNPAPVILSSIYHLAEEIMLQIEDHLIELAEIETLKANILPKLSEHRKTYNSFEQSKSMSSKNREQLLKLFLKKEG